MSSETSPSGESRNGSTSGAAVLQNAELLGAYDELVQVGQSFKLIVRPSKPRFIENPAGIEPHIVDTGARKKDKSYTLTRVSDDPAAPFQYLMDASDAQMMPVELLGATTPDALHYDKGVVRKDLPFILSAVGVAIPDMLNEAFEPGGGLNVYTVEPSQQMCYFLSVVVAVKWPENSAPFQPPTADGAAGN